MFSISIPDSFRVAKTSVFKIWPVRDCAHTTHIRNRLYRVCFHSNRKVNTFGILIGCVYRDKQPSFNKHKHTYRFAFNTNYIMAGFNSKIISRCVMIVAENGSHVNQFE